MPFRHWRPCIASIPSHPIPFHPVHHPALSTEPTSCRFSDSCQLEVERLSDVVPLLLQVRCRNLPPSSSEQPNLNLLHMQAGREERSTKRRWQQCVSPSLAGELGQHFVPILPVRSSKSDSLLPAPASVAISQPMAASSLQGQREPTNTFLAATNPTPWIRLSKSPLDLARICHEKTHCAELTLSSSIDASGCFENRD
jgi:hypothetical protein